MLATRDAAAEVARGGMKQAACLVVEFNYNSGDYGGNICAGNWGATMRSNSRQSVVFRVMMREIATNTMSWPSSLLNQSQ